ncbi:hypothetical protein [Oceanobacillus caeni]|uniref:hypothetical protein n=1 Tax=Oceanobacillus caeni TaxID=405946 RepID=UPI00363F3AA1
MKWKDVCQTSPNQWVLIEAVQAYTNEDGERILEEITPLKKFSNSLEAMREYQALHREDPKGNYMYFILTVKSLILLRKNG